MWKFTAPMAIVPLWDPALMVAENTVARARAAIAYASSPTQDGPALLADRSWGLHPGESGFVAGAQLRAAALCGTDSALTVKLPVSYEMALTLPYMSPAGHGLWKGGWAALRQRDGDEVDIETIKGWIVQSYRAVATRKMVKLLDAGQA